MSENLQKNTQSLMKAAWLIALITIFSKFIGFFRDIVIANFYGADISDAQCDKFTDVKANHWYY